MSKYSVVWLVETVALCAVNCYGIITGYNYYGRSIKFDKILRLYLQVIFYSVGITLIYWLLCGNVNANMLFRSVMPILSTCYWYVTAYFGMLIFVPAINSFVLTSNRLILNITLSEIFVLLSTLPVIFGVDPFRLNRGYSAFWLLILYFIGAYIKKYNIKNISYVKYYACIVLVSWLSKVCTEVLMFYSIGSTKPINIFLKYTSPTILIAAIFLVIAFNDIKISSIKQRKLIGYLAPTTLGVYLIHEHPLIRASIVKNSMLEFVDLNVVVLIFVIFFVALITFLLCSCIDSIRNKLFVYFKVAALFDGISSFIKGKFLTILCK